MMDIAGRFEQNSPKLLFVASTGGHLEQIVRLSRASSASADSVWVTFDSPQSDSLLASRRNVRIPEIPTRDWRGALKSISIFDRILSEEKFDGVVSTGAAIAVPAFIAARKKRVPTLYVESVSRVEGPSMTGRLVAGTRLAGSLQTQHEHWAGPRWKFHGSVLESYTSSPRQNSGYSSAFVTLGTLKKYQFPAMVESVLRAGAANSETVWQLGSTPPPASLPGEAFDYLPSSRFDELSSQADVVVSHAGVGSVLRLLSLGVYPILLVRRSSRGEQVDDHQAQIADVMRTHDLAVVREVDDLVREDFDLAASRQVTIRSDIAGD